jgi:tetratricopeptide (TPR) repeat protein
MRILLTIICLCSFSLLFAQQEGLDVCKGNRSYGKENYTESEVHYRRGLDKNSDSFESHFNLGDALFRQEKYPEALEQYVEAEKCLKVAEDLREEKLNSRLADTYHNIGNACYAQQQYDQAVAAYQQSLRHNPKDDETRYNLVKAMQQLKQQQQQQNQQNQQQQQQQQQQQEQQEDQQQQQNQQQEPQQGEQQMDKETAEQILQALEQDEQETQEKMQRQQGKKRRLEKEW